MALLLSSLLLLSSTVVAQLPLPPSQDSFYTPPEYYQYTSPGTVLSSRTITPSFLGLIPDLSVSAYQVLFSTTAINGSIVAEVTTIFVPTNASTDKFVSFHTAYDSAATICEPSYNYQLLAVQTDLISSAEMLILQGFLLGGYIVSSPDYEGPDAAFGAGRLAGMGVLDSMTAVTSYFEDLDIPLTTAYPDIVGVGYSGGAIATGWAASLASTYAPTLPIVGWAMGGTPANLTGTALYLDNTPFSGFVPAAIDGLSKPSAYNDTLGALIPSIVTPYGQTILDLASVNCGPVDLLTYPDQSILNTDFQSLGAELFYDPIVASVLSQQTMGVDATLTPEAPVYIYHASQDEIIPYANASTLVASWCADNASVNFVTYANGGHISTEILAVGDVYTFVANAFAGTVATTGCTASTTLANYTDPIADIAELEPLLADLLELLSVVGDADEDVEQDLGLLNSTVVTTEGVVQKNATLLGLKHRRRV